MGVLIDDICLWHLSFDFLSFSFIRKECNKAAYALATEALSSHMEQVWLEDQPAYISSFVQFILCNNKTAIVSIKKKKKR